MKVFILEDDLHRDDMFRDFFSHSDQFVDLHVAKNVVVAQKIFDPPYGITLLDHDLGDEVFVPSSFPNTGATFLRWVKGSYAVREALGTTIIHSWNHVGAMNMKHILEEVEVEHSIVPFSPRLFSFLTTLMR